MSETEQARPKRSVVPWTIKEITTLRKLYGTIPLAELAQRMPRHSESSIAAMAIYLRLRVRGPKKDWLAICRAHKPTFKFGGAMGG